MDLRELIYSKCFDAEIQQDLLKISSSSSWVEDLIDYIGEIIVENIDLKKELTQKDREILVDENVKKKMKKLVIELAEETAIDTSHDIANIDTSHDIIDNLRVIFNNLVKQKMNIKTVKIGGIICPIDEINV